jgi:4-carboxymuconolactone decarboxylase
MAQNTLPDPRTFGPSRIQEIPPEQMTAEQVQVFDNLRAGRGRILTPYLIWLHSPQLALALERLGTFLNKQGSLSEREVELGIVIIARHWHGTYVATVHASTLRKLGMGAVVDAIEAGTEPAFDSPRERAVYELSRGALRPEPLDDERFAAAVAALGQTGVAETLALLGYYTAVAIAMKTYRVPLQGAPA